MEGFETAPFLMEELLNFASDIGEEEDDDDKAALDLPPPPPPPPPSSSSPEVEEEELEWLSNKDAFPEVETFVGILPAGSGGNFPKQRSPVSVLETSNSGAGVTIMSCSAGFQVPVKARSKRLRRKRLSAVPVQQWFWNNQHLEKKKKKSMKVERTTQFKTTSGRKCLHCQAEKTPQWRAGPDGPKTLCNACGVRYKSGRLVPEYRPASSPTFSTQLHSNSHRKIMEMRKVKQTEMG